VFIYHERRNVVQVERLAAVSHRQRQLGGFVRRHPAQHDCHQPSRRLIVGNLAVRISCYKETDFVGGQFLAVAFFDDEVYGSHVHLAE
jgi:hypothetical protein